MSQAGWCSRLYLEFSITFLLIYLLDCKFVDLMIFSFYKAKFVRPNDYETSEFSCRLFYSKYDTSTVKTSAANFLKSFQNQVQQFGKN